MGVISLQWESDRPQAYHVRRRLTEAEAMHTGAVCDLRGTAQGWARFERIKTSLPWQVMDIAVAELGRAIDT